MHAPQMRVGLKVNFRGHQFNPNMKEWKLYFLLKETAVALTIEQKAVKSVLKHTKRLSIVADIQKEKR